MDKIFLLDSNDNLVEMKKTPYDSEDFLQSLIEQFPNLLAGDQINDQEPRKWMFISREVPVPDEIGSNGRWSLDHLFIDQDGIPTFIEVKRSSDTRIRREVVGQMLDYAANALIYWSTEKIRAYFELRCKSEKSDPIVKFSEIVGPENKYDDFWQSVKINLQAGKIRLLFIADEIPKELKRIVEFLNEQMDPAEVFALEIKQYLGKNNKTLVPSLIGQSVKNQTKKASHSRHMRKWDEASFFTNLNSNFGLEISNTAKSLLEWCKDKKLKIWWGSGQYIGNFVPVLDQNNLSYYSFSVSTEGCVDIQFQHMKGKPKFGKNADRLNLLEQINMITGIQIPESKIDGRPSFPLSHLKDENNRNIFFDIWDDYFTKIKNGE